MLWAKMLPAGRQTALISVTRPGRASFPLRFFSFSAPAYIEIRSCKGLRNSTFPELVGSPHSKLHNVVWQSPLQNIYVVKKPWNDTVRDSMVQLVQHLHHLYPAVNVLVSADVAEELAEQLRNTPGVEKQAVYTGTVSDIASKTDLIVTLGGDGTILRAVSAFLDCKVPPVLSFAMGTLGFLLPFDFRTVTETFRQVYESRSKALHRNRLECHVVRKSEQKTALSEEDASKIKQYEMDHYKQHHVSSMLHAMNDVVLHRGSQPNLLSLEIYIDNEFLTTTTADGVVFATPTGSTAYSLSGGGSITHPLVPCILLTPICPRSLSFRPLILPSTSHIMVRLSATNRNVLVKLTIDGIPQEDLAPGDEIHVVSESGTIYIPGKIEPPRSLTKRNEFDLFIEPGSSNGLLEDGHGAENDAPDTQNTDMKHRGIWCVARSENDWTKDINELLGFNSSFRGSSKK